MSKAQTISDEHLHLLGEQFQALKEMTFQQFMDSVLSGRIVIAAKEVAIRKVSNIPSEEDEDNEQKKNTLRRISGRIS